VDGASVLVALPGLVVALAVLALVVPALVVPALVVSALVVVPALVVLALVVPTLVVEIAVDVVDGPLVVKKCRSCNLQVVFEHHAVGSPSPISPKCSSMAKFDESRMVNQKT